MTKQIFTIHWSISSYIKKYIWFFPCHMLLYFYHCIREFMNESRRTLIRILIFRGIWVWFFTSLSLFHSLPRSRYCCWLHRYFFNLWYYLSPSFPSSSLSLFIETIFETVSLRSLFFYYFLIARLQPPPPSTFSFSLSFSFFRIFIDDILWSFYNA